MNDRRKAVTVRVMVHLTADGQYAVGVVTSEWQGAVRVDRRLQRLRPLAPIEYIPMGVDRDVFAALVALRALVDEQQESAASRLLD